MIASEHTQSLSQFRKSAAETIERLNQTGEAEILTLNGQARAVLISPALYDELARAREAEIERDVATIRRSREEIAKGHVRDVEKVFADLRAELMQLKAKRKAAG
jgi:PHD/YefM family antitoxin component YafN of YafNO toxin-antitoxin module